LRIRLARRPHYGTTFVHRVEHLAEFLPVQQQVLLTRTASPGVNTAALAARAMYALQPQSEQAPQGGITQRLRA